MRYFPIFFLLFTAALLVGCGSKGTTPAANAPAAAEPTAGKIASAISLDKVFDGGSYRCTVESPQGELTMKIKGNKFRYEMPSPQGTFTIIAEYSKVQTTAYTYLPQQDKWFKYTFTNAEQPKAEAPILTPQNIKQYPKYRCVVASTPDSEFTVPADKVVDQTAMLAALQQSAAK